MKISLIFTVRNEAGSIDRLLAGIDAQTRPPDEVVVMDGGSTDDTVERIKKWAEKRNNVAIGRLPGCNISTGRNRAIELAQGPVIAVTDAGCVPEPQWLEKLAEPLEDPETYFSMGFYVAETEGLFEKLTGCLNVPDVREVDPDKFMPSSRSVAFRKSVWSHVDGYPEWLEVGEDMYFDFVIRTQGLKRAFAPEAVVRWRLRAGLRSFLSQYFHYARGDSLGGMYMYRHAARFFAYTALALLTPVWVLGPVWLLGPAVLAAGWLRRPYRRALSRLSVSEAMAALIALPALEVLMDFAKMAGYLTGLAQTWKRYTPSKVGS